MKPVKQVIVVRTDLNMGVGKIASQVAHASISFLVNNSIRQLSDEETSIWLNGPFTKICLRVNSDEELFEIYQNASLAGLKSVLITDSGKTVFNGIPTNTCVGIGPNYSENIDKVCGHLKLL